MFQQYILSNWFIWFLYASALFVVILFGFVIWIAYKDGQLSADSIEKRNSHNLSTDSLKKSFKQATKFIESYSSNNQAGRDMSWTLVLNEGINDHNLPLVESGISRTISAKQEVLSPANGLSWSFFDRGVVIQLLSNYLGEIDNNSNSKTLETLLNLCQDYRPNKPLDSVVIALPAEILMLKDPEEILELVARAKQVHRRLWLTQNKLHQRLPIYLVISKCESIPGFSAFANKLPETIKNTILGWSSPHELFTPYQSNWIDMGINEIYQNLTQICAEICALELEGTSSSEYFLVPTEVEKLRDGLKLFTEELMRASSFHYPFLLRGFYLTGDCNFDGESSELIKLNSEFQETDIKQFHNEDSVTQKQIIGINKKSEKIFKLDSKDSSINVNSAKSPAFLRDIFEHKIFPETGLVQWVTNDRRKPNSDKKWIQILSFIFPCVWTLGILLSGVELDKLSNGIANSFEKLQKYNELYGSSNDIITLINPVNRKQLAIDALNNIDQVSSGRLFSIFMPGSWPIFDDLSERTHEKMEESLATNSYEILLDTADIKVTELTGVQFEFSTGVIKPGSQCKISKGLSDIGKESESSVTNIEDLPEFRNSLKFIQQVQEIDQAINALIRLRSSTSPASGKDLKLVLKILLDFELDEKNLDRRSQISGVNKADKTAELFRALARHSPPILIEPLQTALTCTLKLNFDATYHKLFNESDLLKATQSVAQNSVGLLTTNTAMGETTNSPIPRLQKLLNAMETQQSMFNASQGAWIHEHPMNLGKVYNSMLGQIGAISLLGPNFAEETEKSAKIEFNKFLIDWNFSLADQKNYLNLKSGVEWSQHDARWTIGGDQQIFFNALKDLLYRPYMIPSKFMDFPDISSNATIQWDMTRLDQILTLIVQFKNFENTTLIRFPQNQQEYFNSIVKDNVAGLANDLLVEGIKINSKFSSDNLQESSISKLIKIRNWLAELGADEIVDDLNNVMQHDALVRLNKLDDEFEKAGIFTPKENEFSSWRDEKFIMANAFGANNADELSNYVDQQIILTDNFYKLARPLLLEYGDVRGNNAIIQRWQTIGNDIEKYKSKNPNNNLSQLTQFILTTSNDLDLSNCINKLNVKNNTRRAGAFFNDRLSAIKSGLYIRCTNLKLNESKNAWANFSTYFNQNLSNRSPFIDSRDMTQNNKLLPNEQRISADQNDLEVVLKLFEQAHNSINWKSLASISNLNISVPPAIQQFDEQMQIINNLLSPLYLIDEGQIAGLDVLIELRANKESELEGNKIINWTISIGHQTIQINDPAKIITWTPGTPITMTLQFAKDGPVFPKATTMDSNIYFSNRSIIFRFEDPWALFTMINKYRIQEKNSTTISKSQLLRLEFPLVQTKAESSASKSDPIARLFIRTTVSPTGKHKPLIWPYTFPTKAPSWKNNN